MTNCILQRENKTDVEEEILFITKTEIPTATLKKYLEGYRS